MLEFGYSGDELELFERKIVNVGKSANSYIPRDPIIRAVLFIGVLRLMESW